MMSSMCRGLRRRIEVGVGCSVVAFPAGRFRTQQRGCVEPNDPVSLMTSDLCRSLEVRQVSSFLRHHIKMLLWLFAAARWLISFFPWFSGIFPVSAHAVLERQQMIKAHLQRSRS